MNRRKRDLPFKKRLKNNIGDVSSLFPRYAADKNSIRVLTYHNITDRPVPNEWGEMTTPHELFERQMEYLKENGYNTISAREVFEVLVSVDGNISEKTVCITFDDGYKDNYENAYPALEKYGLKATVFVTAGFIGKGKGAFGEYLSWREIREMKKSGVFTFGCHSFSHRNLVGLREDELDEEIKGGKDVLEDATGSEAETFAYPFGWHSAFNKQVRDAVEKQGFLCAFTGVQGANTRKTDLFRLRRLRVSWMDHMEEFQKVLIGAYDWYSAYQRVVSTWKR
ncbi:MAG: polysaccharide deacetylase family protein [Omnitrophica bacterium]|nr:polysaccharide deacetylase family protein [Candidatus Omnitrophota bacterium]